MVVPTTELCLVAPNDDSMAIDSSSSSSRSERCGQLTVFYAGSVNVFDNVPEDKARAIMLLAGNAGNAGSLFETLPNLSQFAEPVNKIRKLQGLPDAPSSASFLSLNSQFSSFRPALPKMAAVPSHALPQARKASLTRFLQRRKQRAQSPSSSTVDGEKPSSLPAASEGIKP